MKHGSQKLIANNLEISPSYLNDIIKGRAKCPPALALRLERTTGINRAIWVWGSVDEIKTALDERYGDEGMSQSMPKEYQGAQTTP